MSSDPIKRAPQPLPLTKSNWIHAFHSTRFALARKTSYPIPQAYLVLTYLLTVRCESTDILVGIGATLPLHHASQHISIYCNDAYEKRYDTVESD